MVKIAKVEPLFLRYRYPAHLSYRFAAGVVENLDAGLIRVTADRPASVAPADGLSVITRPVAAVAGDAGDSVPSAHEGGRCYTRSRTRAPPGTGEDAVRPWRRLTPGVRAGV